MAQTRPQLKPLLAVGVAHGALLWALLWVMPGAGPAGPVSRPQDGRVLTVVLDRPAAVAAPNPALSALSVLPLLPLPAPAPTATLVSPAPAPAVQAEPEPELAAPAIAVVAVPSPLIAVPAGPPQPSEPIIRNASADHRHCPAAPHPAALRERGIEGAVLLRVRVDTQGRAADVQVVAASGWRLFDEAALQGARGCRFIPAQRAGEPVDSWVEFPVRFVLTG